MKLLPYPHQMGLGEVFQANDMKFAFVNPHMDDFQMVHSWVKCREYFNELLMKNHHPEYEFVKTYGFDYRPTEFPLDLSATRIAVKFMSTKQKQVFMDNLQWIHSVESANDIDHTIVHDISEQEVLLIASKLWVQKCLLTNIYTLLVKLAALNITAYTKTSLVNIRIKEQTPSEIDYINRLTVPVFNSILENCTVIAEIPSKYVDGTEEARLPYAVHGYSGLMSLLLCKSKKKSENVLYALTNGLKKTFLGKYKTAFIKEAT